MAKSDQCQRARPRPTRLFEIHPVTLGRERTLGWMTRWRRLVRDYEARIDVSEAMIHVAMGGLLLRGISH